MPLWIDQKYVGLVSLQLSQFKKKADSLYNFRCPYCGDSQKNKHKARGYLYAVKDSIVYKCHNCNQSASLLRFLEHVNSALASSYRLEKYTQAKERPVETPKEDKTLTEFTTTLDELACLPLSKLPESSQPVQYAISRKIPHERWSDLYYAPNAKILEKLNPVYKDRLAAEERLIIPFRDRTGKLSGVTARSLGTSKLRYVAIRLSEYPMIYGLDRVDSSKPVYVCEGAFDSMFVENAIAVGGSDLVRVIGSLPQTKLIFIFDNEPRNKSIVSLMEKLIAYNHSMVIWPKNWQYKDINEAIVAGVTQEALMRVIHTNTHSGLPLKLAIRDWKKL